jgi:hypothetical protein
VGDRLMPQRSAHQLVDFLTAVRAHEGAEGATAAAAELAAEQLERLRMLDCELGEGYHFSVPLDGAELTAYLEQALEHERRAA